MRRMSFALTERQLRDGSKTVTRRLGWRTLKAGDELLAVNKCMGLRKGESARKLARIRVVNVCREPVANATNLEARLEGFPHMTGAEFAAFFCKAMKCEPHTLVTRITFRVEELFT
jgi:hypothetical protein